MLFSFPSDSPFSGKSPSVRRTQFSVDEDSVLETCSGERFERLQGDEDASYSVFCFSPCHVLPQGFAGRTRCWREGPEVSRDLAASQGVRVLLHSSSADRCVRMRTRAMLSLHARQVNSTPGSGEEGRFPAAGGEGS